MKMAKSVRHTAECDILEVNRDTTPFIESKQHMKKKKQRESSTRYNAYYA